MRTHTHRHAHTGVSETCSLTGMTGSILKISQFILQMPMDSHLLKVVSGHLPTSIDGFWKNRAAGPALQG